MLQVVRDTILRYIDDESARFVFPSEVAVRFWRKQTLLFSGKRAIAEARFVSWDSFKEAAYREERFERPVNSLYRTIFSAALLAENSSGPPLFSELVPRSFSAESGSFVRDIGALLPVLESILSPRGEGALPPNLRADLATLRDRYREFLRANSLFEPLDRPLRAIPVAERFFVCFPEVIEDAERYLAPLADSGRVQTISAPAMDPDGKGIELVRYSSWSRELRALFRRVRGLLESGTEPSDIIVTVCGLEALRPVIEEYGDLYGVPLAFRSGKPLASHSPGRMLSALQETYRDGFRLDSLKGLFLDLGIPWKEREMFRGIIRTGIEGHCLGTWREGNSVRDAWSELFRRTGRKEEGDLFRAFAREAAGLVTSPDFPSLGKNFGRFLERFLDPHGWSQQDLRILQYIKAVLGETIDSVQRLVGVICPDPYGLFLSLLSGGLYVEKADPGAVGIYPFRVTAGIDAPHHFIVNASQEGTSARIAGIPFLSEELGRSVGLEERDLRPQFLSLYGKSGGEIRFSFSASGFSGPDTPPGYIVSRGIVTDAAEDDTAADPYASERIRWGGDSAAAFIPHAVQREGFDNAARTLFVPRRMDAALEPLPAGIRETCEGIWRTGSAGNRGTDSAGQARGIRGGMSASALERFWGCPFSFLLSDILGIEEGEFDFSFSDPLVFGQLQHDALRLLMSPAEGQGGTDGRNGGGGRSEAGGRDAAAGSNRSEANGHWKAGADHGEAAGANDPDLEAAWRAVSRAFDAWERAGRPRFPPPGWRSFRERAAERAAAFLRRDREEFAGYETAYVERWVDWVDEETGILLTGRIDRIARKDDRYHLIDYKNSGYVSKGNVAVEPGATGSYQIPFYTLLCRNSGIDVEGASYYILSEGKFSRFFGAEDGKAWFSREETLALAENVRAAAALMAGRIAEGDYGATAGDLCGDCGFRVVCRIRYVIR